MFIAFILLHTSNRLLLADFIVFRIGWSCWYAHLFCTYKLYSVIFYIDKACLYAREGVIRKSNWYTLRSNVCWSLVNLQVKLIGTLGLLSETWRTMPLDSSVLIFASIVSAQREAEDLCPISCILSTSTIHRGNHRTTKVPRSWAPHWRYAYVHSRSLHRTRVPGTR